MLSLLLLVQAAVVPPACPATSPLARWYQARPATILALDMPAVLTASEQPKTDPKQQGKVATADFTVARAGTYTIAYGATGWVDVLTAGGTKLNSVAHGHGTCGGVAKLVAFSLPAGRYRLRGDGIVGTDVHVALLSGDQTKGTVQ